MPYCKGPYARHSSLPSPSVFTLHSSRKIDFVTRRYELDDNGNPLPMPSTAQRVALQLDFAIPSGPPKFIDDTNLELREKQLTAALQTLIAEGAIRLESVSATEARPGVASSFVDYTDLNTAADDSLEWTQ